MYCELGCALPESKEYLGPDITDRDCILVENIIDTAKSIIDTAEFLKNKGASRIIVSAVHGVFTGDAGQRIKKSHIENIIVTNSYSDQESSNEKVIHISIAKVIAKVIAKLHFKQSLDEFRANKQFNHTP